MTQLIDLGTKLAAQFPQSLKSYLIVAGFPVAPIAQSAVPILLDPLNQLHDQYGVKDACLYLIRPDMYVAFRSAIDQQAGLAAYLDNLLIPIQQAAHGA